MRHVDVCRHVQLGKIQDLIKHYNETLNHNSEARLELCFLVTNPFREKKSNITELESSYASIIITSNKVIKNRFGKDGVIFNENDFKTLAQE